MTKFLFTTSFVILLLGLYNAAEANNEDSTAFEWASFFPAKSSPRVTTPRSSPLDERTEYIVYFRAYNRTFTMQMREISATDYSNVDVTIIRPNGSEVYAVSDYIRYFKGHIRELPDSRAHGVLRSNGLFEGIIETPDETYFVESPLRFFGNTAAHQSSAEVDKNRAVIYRWQDLRQFPIQAACENHEPACYYYQTMQHYKALFPPEETIQPKRGGHSDRKYQKAENGKVCPMHVIADHRFFQNAGYGSVQSTLEAIVWHIEEMDHLYQRTDWDSDEALDRLGVSLKKVTIFTSPYSPDNPFAEDTQDDEVFLKNFKQRSTADVCIAVVFTYADLKGTFGISYVGTVCRPRYNWALINFRNIDGQIRQRAASVITTMHEVAHVFGANHDEDPECIPAGVVHNDGTNGGNYIMYPTSAFGMFEHNRQFSSCSTAAIAKNMQDPRKTRCMEAVS